MTEGRPSAVIRFRLDKFTAHGEALKLDFKDTAARARFVGMNHGTLWKVEKGRQRVGPAFVARVLSAPWPLPVKFEDFFETEAA